VAVTSDDEELTMKQDQNRTAKGQFAEDPTAKARGAGGVATVNLPVGAPQYEANRGAQVGAHDATEALAAARAATRRSRIDHLLEIADRVGEGGAFRVNPATGVTLPSQVRVPEVHLELDEGGQLTPREEAAAEAELERAGWTLWSKGRSGQYQYRGGWLHPSEYMSDSMAEDMLAEGGLYAVVYPSTYDDDSDPLGWGILHRAE
jgi:hypothetical protein